MVVVAPLVALGTLALVLWIIAFVAALAVVIGYIAGVLHGLPYPIDQLAGPVNSLSQGLSNVAGKMFSKAEQIAGGAWHAFARYLDKTWEQMEAQAHLAWAQTEILAGHIYDVTGLRAAVKSLTNSFRGIEHGVKNVEQWALREERRVKRLEHALFHGIGEDVLPRLKTLEHEYEHIQNKELKAIRREWATTEAEVRNLYDFLKGKASLIGIGTFAFAIAATIGQDVFRLLRCDGAGAIARKYRCGLWDLLGSLLALAGLLTIAFDFPEFVKAAETVAEGIGDVVQSIEGTFEMSLPPLPPPQG